MATQYIKYAKKCEKKVFFLNHRGGGGHGFFWPGDGYAHALLHITKNFCKLTKNLIRMK